MTRYAVRAGWRPGRATSAIFVAATLAACHRSTPSATHATPPATSAAHEAPLAWKSTAELVRDPELRALVDELAQKKRVEGHAVGEAGAPSEIFALYTRAVKKASHGDRVALVSHLSPVVRVYFAESLLGETPPSIDAIYPLFRDDTEVETLDGCLGEDGIVSTAILRMAWTLPRETRAALVTRVARDASLPGTARAYALRDLANEGGDDVRPIALSAIGSAEPLGPAALHALAEAAEPEDVDRIVPFASSPSPHVRAGAAHALGASCDVKAVRALEPLLADPDPDVKRLAVKSYVVQTAADPARVAKLLADDDRWFREAALAGVAKRPDGSGLALLEPALMSDDPPSEEVMSDLFS